MILNRATAAVTFFFFFFLPFAAQGQISSATGAIQGLVTDPQNSAIAGAKVILKNTATEATAETSTVGDGFFVFPLLAPGKYDLTVQNAGFRESTKLDGVTGGNYARNQCQYQVENRAGFHGRRCE